MLRIFQGQRPDITPAQLVALIVGGVPVVANLLHVFGVYDLSIVQQDALTKTIQWGGIVAVGLLGADAGLRAARGHADARVKAVALSNPAVPAVGPPTNGVGVASTVPQGAMISPAPSASGDENLPSDAEEFAYQPGDATAPGAGDSDAEHAFEPGDGDQGPDSRLSPAVPDDIL